MYEKKEEVSVHPYCFKMRNFILFFLFVSFFLSSFTQKLDQFLNNSSRTAVKHFKHRSESIKSFYIEPFANTKKKKTVKFSSITRRDTCDKKLIKVKEKKALHL